MPLGLHALGIGAGADRAVIDAVAAGAERGFATLWSGSSEPQTGRRRVQPVRGARRRPQRPRGDGGAARTSTMQEPRQIGCRSWPNTGFRR